MYPKNAIDKLLWKIDIVQVIKHYLGEKLKPRGRSKHEWIAKCPFHNERTPSFTVTSMKQFYHCFGCGSHGNAITFVMQYEHLDFFQAVEKISNITGVHITSGKTVNKRARQRTRDTLRGKKAHRRGDAQKNREYRNRMARAHANYEAKIRRSKVPEVPW